MPVDTAALAEILLQRAWRCAFAESCTGGMLAARCTELAGSSRWFERGLVTYSNEAKQELLSVQTATLARFGAVSRETVMEMARGLLDRAPVQLSAAISGIAVPDGGSEDKPVGTVWIAVATEDSIEACHFQFDGDRAAVRTQACEAALRMLYSAASNA